MPQDFSLACTLLTLAFAIAKSMKVRRRNKTRVGPILLANVFVTHSVHDASNCRPLRPGLSNATLLISV